MDRERLNGRALGNERCESPNKTTKGLEGNSKRFPRHASGHKSNRNLTDQRTGYITIARP